MDAFNVSSLQAFELAFKKNSVDLLVGLFTRFDVRVSLYYLSIIILVLRVSAWIAWQSSSVHQLANLPSV